MDCPSPAKIAKLEEGYVKKLGPFLIGQQLPVVNESCLGFLEYLGRDPVDDTFYTLKTLSLPEDPSKETKREFVGRSMIHTEYSLLSILADVPGIIRCRALIKDKTVDVVADPQNDNSEESLVPTSLVTSRNRITLAFNCLYPHDFCRNSKDFINLLHFVVKEKPIQEKTALRIFYQMTSIICDVHNRNVVHRDLKLSNFVLNRRNKRITLISFGLGKHLSKDDELLTESVGSPKYISPEMHSGKPYLGKPNDIWSLGIILYAMVFGYFPFNPSAFQASQREGFLTLPPCPGEGKVSQKTYLLIQKILVLNPKARLNASQIQEALRKMMTSSSHKTKTDVQVVPNMVGETTSLTNPKNGSVNHPRQPAPFHICARLDSHSKCPSHNDVSTPSIPSPPANSLSMPILPTTSSTLVLPRAPFGRVVLRRVESPVVSDQMAPRRQISFVRVDNDGRLLGREEAATLKRRLTQQIMQTTTNSTNPDGSNNPNSSSSSNA